MEIFWSTIARYNAATWPWQVVIVAVAALLTIALHVRPTRWTGVAMKLFLAALNGWISVVYFAIHCGERAHHEVQALFWAIMSAVWIYELRPAGIRFERTSRPWGFALLLWLLPLAYPLLSLARGLRFPMMTMPVMPCSVAVFTVGLMVAFTRRINLFLLLFLSHWAVIGLAKVYFFAIPEDFLLGAATLPALWIFLREYVAAGEAYRTKPGPGVFRALIGVLTVLAGLIFAVTLVQQIRLYL